MSLKLSLDDKGIRVVDNIKNKIETKHDSTGKEDVIPLYIFNDGLRYGQSVDPNPPELLYTDIMVSLEGVSHILQKPIPASTGSVSLEFNSTEGWNIGTVITSKTERMRIELIEPNGTVINVRRNYQDGGSSIITDHNTGAAFISETKSAYLALPDVGNYDTPGAFGDGGVALTAGLDPTYLSIAIDSRPTSTTVRSSSGVKYYPKSLIKIDDEIMRVDAVSGNDLTVTRGYNNTAIVNHVQNSIIYCVGLVDKMVGNDASKSHKIFLKVKDALLIE
ncbi:MAG: hypothetical protein ACRC1P_10970 [Cellulosilyticaceae bacterium]